MNHETEYLPLPQPEEIIQTEKEDAMGSYLMMFASWAVGLPLPAINIIAAVIYYFVNRKKGLFVKFHAMQSMYSAILIGIINAGFVIWSFSILIHSGGNWQENAPVFGNQWFAYLIVTVLGNIIYFIFSVIAAVKAKKGQFYYFIFFGKLSYHRTFNRKLAEKMNEAPKANLPPRNL